MNPVPRFSLAHMLLALGGLSLGASAEAASTRGSVGLGVVVGEPTALSFAWRPGDTWYIQAALGWNVSDDRVALNVDYIMTLTTLEADGASGVVFPVYVGVGGRLRLDDDDWGDWDDDFYDDHNDHDSLGVRVPLGISMLPAKVPIDVFAELVPVVELIPSTDLEFDAGVGVRFYF